MAQTQSRKVTVRVDADLADTMDLLHARDGISPSEMIRRALEAWLATKGLRTKPARRKAGLHA